MNIKQSEIEKLIADKMEKITLEEKLSFLYGALHGVRIQLGDDHDLADKIDAVLGDERYFAKGGE